MKSVFFKVVGSATLATVTAVSFSAMPAYAKNGKGNAGGGGTTTLEQCSVDDIIGAINPINCAGAFSGNDSQGNSWSTELNDNDVFGTESWTFGSKIDGGGSNSDFSLSNNGATGTITFLQDIDYEFAVALKAGQGWSLYEFAGASSGQTITYDTKGTALSGDGVNGRALSHASLYISDKSVDTTPEPQEVPEPASIGGLALLGGILTLRGRRKS